MKNEEHASMLSKLFSVKVLITILSLLVLFFLSDIVVFFVQRSEISLCKI